MRRNVLKLAMSLVVALTFSVGASWAQDDNAEALNRLSRIVEAWRASPHADISAEAFTHWNDEEEAAIPGRCAVCHSGIGFNDYVSGDMAKPGAIDHPVVLGNTVDCAACHGAAVTGLASVPFPSGVIVEDLGSSAMCMVCHQGRASTNTVASATDGLEDDTVSADLSFINIHYAAAAATQMGSVTRSGYEYDGKEYKGRFSHVPDFQQCTDCHRPHSTNTVALENCTQCHQTAESFASIRISPTDFDGDGNTSEGIVEPIMELHGRLYSAIQAYASTVSGTPVVYAPDSYPYFFIDGDANGQVSDGEAAYPNRYKSWTPRLLKAAYNYQVIAKDKGIYTHNPHYALQLLYDSLEDMGTSVDVGMANLARP